jgi:hypothetical protein
MNGLFGYSGKVNNVKVDVTPSAATINATGKTLKNAVANAKSVANALNVVSKQLSDASISLKNKAPVIANVAADAVKANAPVAAKALEPVVGGANAALIGNMPKGIIVGGARRAVEEAARQIKKLSGAARDASDALNEGINNVGKVANYIANNVEKVDPNSVNNAVNKATNVVNTNVGSMVNTSLKLNSNLNKSTLNSIAQVAGSVASAAFIASRKNKNKKNGGASRKNKKDRKNKKNGGASRKNKKNGGASRKDKKNGGFLSLF